MAKSKLIASISKKKREKKKIDGIIIPSLHTKAIIRYVDDHQSGSYIYIYSAFYFHGRPVHA
jgi:hypothetical protein